MTSKQYININDDELIYDFNITLEFHFSCNVCVFLAYYDLSLLKFVFRICFGLPKSFISRRSKRELESACM